MCQTVGVGIGESHRASQPLAAISTCPTLMPQLLGLSPFIPANWICTCRIAVDETVTLLHPPLPLVGVSIVMERVRQ